MSEQYPDDLRYTKEHTWARVYERNGIKYAVVGITQVVIQRLGEISQAELPREGDEFQREQALGTLQSARGSFKVPAPVSGYVRSVNDPVRDTPVEVSRDCYGEGWLVELEVTNPDELGQLMSAHRYQAGLGGATS
jgi:glycine cleavage system H protein